MKCKFTNLKCNSNGVCHKCSVANRNLCFSCSKYTFLCGADANSVVLGSDIVDQSNPSSRLNMNNVVSCKNYVPLGGK